jgi:hypothetical protein
VAGCRLAEQEDALEIDPRAQELIEACEAGDRAWVAKLLAADSSGEVVNLGVLGVSPLVRVIIAPAQLTPTPPPPLN